MFEHTTSIAVCKDQLQGLLVVFVHGLFVLARLRSERRHFFLSHPNIQKKRSSLKLQVGSLNLSLAPGLFGSRQGVSNPNKLLFRPCLLVALRYGSQSGDLSFCFGFIPFFFRTRDPLYALLGLPFPVLRSIFGLCLGHLPRPCAWRL